MKSTKSLLALVLAFISIESFSQCTGNCNDGFGALTSDKTTSIGFFKTSKLTGLGDVASDKLYSGQWKEGKKHGLIVYNETGVFNFGLFENDLKSGLHISLLKDGSISAINYDKGIEKIKETIVNTGNADCPVGKCDNGIGIKVLTIGDQRIEMIGKFVNGQLSGPGYTADSKTGNQVYATFNSDIIDGAMVYVYPSGGITLAEMKQGKKQGNVINIFPDGKFLGQQFDNDQAVKKY